MNAQIFKIKDPTTSFYTCIQSRIIITVKKIKIHYTYLYKFISKDEPHTEIIFLIYQQLQLSPNCLFSEYIGKFIFSPNIWKRDRIFLCMYYCHSQMLLFFL